MEHVRARVLEGDKVLHENVEIALNPIEVSPGAKQYNGCFQVQGGSAGLRGNGPFQVHFEDGRVGAFTSPRIEKRTGKMKIAFILDGAPRMRVS